MEKFSTEVVEKRGPVKSREFGDRKVDFWWWWLEKVDFLIYIQSGAPLSVRPSPGELANWPRRSERHCPNGPSWADGHMHTVAGSARN